MRRFVESRSVSWVLSALAVVALLGGMCLISTPTSEAGSKAETLPLADFLDAQGLHEWDPPEPGLYAWTGRPPEYPHAAYMDYAGACDRWLVAHGQPGLGTTVTGTFTRKDIGGDLYEYSVNVHAKNTLAWCKDISDGDWGKPVVFGCHVNEIEGGATPALGEVHFKATWWQQKGTPIADLSFAANYCEWSEELQTCLSWPYRPDGWQMRDIDINGTATGPLHEDAGLGAEGTPGKLVLVQKSSNPQAIGHGGGNADGMPAEVVDLHVVGN